MFHINCYTPIATDICYSIGDELWAAVVDQRGGRSQNRERRSLSFSSENIKDSDIVKLDQDLEDLLMTEKAVHSFPADKPKTNMPPVVHPRSPEPCPSNDLQEIQPLFRPKEKLVVKRKKPEFHLETSLGNTAGIKSSTPTKGEQPPASDCQMFSDSSFNLDESHVDAVVPCSHYGRHIVLDSSVG